MLFVAVFVVESFFELIITLRAASGFVPSSSIRRCPSGSSSSSQGASCVFMFLMVGSMIVVSLAFEGSRFVRRKPSLPRATVAAIRGSGVLSRASSCSSCSSSSSPSSSSSSRFARRAAPCPRRRFGAAPAAAAAPKKVLRTSLCSSTVRGGNGWHSVSPSAMSTARWHTISPFNYADGIDGTQ